MDINISNLPMCYFQGFFFVFLCGNGINISNLPVCYLLPRVFFFLVFLIGKHLSTWNTSPLPSIQGTIQHSHATNLSNIQTKTLFVTKKQVSGKAWYDPMAHPQNCLLAILQATTLKLGWEAMHAHMASGGMGGVHNVLCSQQPCKMKAHSEWRGATSRGIWHSWPLGAMGDVIMCSVPNNLVKMKAHSEWGATTSRDIPTTTYFLMQDDTLLRTWFYFFIVGNILDRYFGIKFNIPMVVKRKATRLLRLRAYTHTHTKYSMRDVGIGPCTSPYHYGQKNPENL